MRLPWFRVSLSAQTPVIGLFSEEWGLKNPGMMTDYEMPYVMIEKGKEEMPAMPTDMQRANITKFIHKYSETLNNIRRDGEVDI